LLAVALLVAAAAFLALTLRIMSEGSIDQPRPADCILVLGAAEYSGRPSPVYRARLDHAYQLFEHGAAPLIITSGGSGKDPKYSEGQVGRDYLLAKGVPEVDLIAETQADDTDESTQRAAVIMRRNAYDSVLLVSDAYHMFRAKRMMQRQGFTVYTSPRPESVPRTKWARFVAASREAVSYLLYRVHVT
jgi:uncharacterized SAM-binding protein YcdF (DUF218 family)